MSMLDTHLIQMDVETPSGRFAEIQRGITGLFNSGKGWLLYGQRVYGDIAQDVLMSAKKARFRIRRLHDGQTEEILFSCKVKALQVSNTIIIDLKKVRIL